MFVATLIALVAGIGGGTQIWKTREDENAEEKDR
jgi:hypothetical protein